jgi:hypothetical protein
LIDLLIALISAIDPGLLAARPRDQPNQDAALFCGWLLTREPTKISLDAILAIFALLSVVSSSNESNISLLFVVGNRAAKGVRRKPTANLQGGTLRLEQLAPVNAHLRGSTGKRYPRPTRSACREYHCGIARCCLTVFSQRFA